MKRRVIHVLMILVLTLSLCLITVAWASANDIQSSTMIFEGTLTDNGDGTYTGTIPMTPGAYYAVGGPGADDYNASYPIQGGFDVYARNEALATYDQDGSAGQNYLVGPIVDHDAYHGPGGWGGFFTPDCADWFNYQLRLDGENNNWYLEYNSGIGNIADPTPADFANALAAPMSGPMDWANMYAAEDGVGVYYDPVTNVAETLGYALANPYTGANSGAASWDMDWSWGSEYIPLQYAGYNVAITPLIGDRFRVVLTPGGSQNIAMTADVNNLVSLSVVPGAIDFGAIIPGTPVPGNDLTVSNMGNVPINVEAELLLMDDLYLNHLFLNGTPSGDGLWEVITPGIDDELGISSIPVLGSDTVTTALNGIPPDYPPGTHLDTIIFWAEMAPPGS